MGKRPAARKRIVGLFVEGNVRDSTRDSISTLWLRLAERCQVDVELKVYGIDKSQIVALQPDKIPTRSGATKKAQFRRETLDVAIDRALRNDGLTHVIVAFDALPANEQLELRGRRHEIGYLLDGILASKVLNGLKKAAKILAERYATKTCLDPRESQLEHLEVLYMDPMFEALLASDEATVRTALGHKSFPKDWPSFKNAPKELDKYVIAPAIEVAHKDVLRKIGGRYMERKTKWALHILEAAPATAALWGHEIIQRLCRLLCNLPAPTSSLI